MSRYSASDIAESVADTHKISKKLANDVVKSVFSGIETRLRNGHEVSIIGFGVFIGVPTMERQGRNPQTGEPITIPAKISMKFKPSKTVKL